MKISLAEHRGFCYGVKRAVKMAEDCREMDKARTLGPIIHNPQVVKKLEKDGIIMADSLSEINEGTVIIRSHGVGPTIYNEAKAKNLNIVDATCPHVKKAQMAAHKLLEEGYNIIIIGEEEHPEVQSIFEWAEGKATVIQTVAQAINYTAQGKIGIVAQTTFSAKAFQEIVSVLIMKATEIKIERTICNATAQRQESAIALAKQVELMLVVGGKNSANTGRLAELCKEVCDKCYHIETVEELKAEWFEGIAHVGVTAGASTPDWVINEVCQCLNKGDAIKENTENVEYTYFKNINVGDIVEGLVVSVRDKEVLVDIGYKAEGFISLAELAYPVPENTSDVVKCGDKIKVLVLSLGGEHGVALSKIKADKVEVWSKLEEALTAKTVFNAIVLEAVKGGLRIAVAGITGFIPSSQIDIKKVEDLSQFKGQSFEVMPIEINEENQKAVFSRRVLLEQARQQELDKIFSELQINQVVTGEVKRITDYGVFVDLGGIDGLIHVSELSWNRVKNPRQVVTEGDVVKVSIINMDKEKQKIGLSLKDVQEDPWFEKVQAITQGAIVSAEVKKIMDYGVFVALENGLEGLIRLSELSDKKINKAEEIVKIGDKINVKIINIDQQNKKLAFSVKQIVSDKEREEFEKYLTTQEKNESVTLGDRFAHLFKNIGE